MPLMLGFKYFVFMMVQSSVSNKNIWCLHYCCLMSFGSTNKFGDMISVSFFLWHLAFLFALLFGRITGN